MTEKEVTSDVVERAQKLLRMAEGGTKHEAEVAVAKLQRLMVEYNLDIQLVKGAVTEEEYVSGDTADEFRMKEAPEDVHSLTIIQEHFFVKVIFSSGRDEDTGEAFKKIVFVGRRENVAVAKALYIDLRYKFRHLWSEYKFVEKCPASSRASFYGGLSNGIDTRIRAERAAVEQERGMVLVEDSDLKDHFNKMFPHLHSRSAPQVGDWSAFQSGIVKGKDINLRTKMEVE